MRLSTAAVLTLFATAQAGPLMRYHFQDHALETRNFASSLKPLALVSRTEAENAGAAAQEAGQNDEEDQANAGDAAAGGDAATSLQDASDALAAATTAVDQALADLGAEGNADDAAAHDDDAAAAAGDAAAESEAGAAAKSTAGGAIVAETLDGLLLPDGRIAADAVPEDFNVVESVFKSAVVKGEGLEFSDVVSFPDVQPSIFDAAGGTKAFEISITDESIFAPDGVPQDENRRADLLPSIISTANDSAVTGVRTLHFSFQQDTAKPLALATNDYQLVFLETGDFADRQFEVRVGTEADSASLNGENIVVLGRVAKSAAAATAEELFVTPFSEEIQNFGITLDFDANTLQVFHSTGATALAQVTEVVANDNSGLGEYHFTLTKNGDQQEGIDEGIIMSGIFMEDSTDGTVTLE